VWKGISYLSGRVLEKASERVVDVQGDDDGDDDGGEGQQTAAGDQAEESRKDV
jgi:hypothetical protein